MDMSLSTATHQPPCYSSYINLKKVSMGSSNSSHPSLGLPTDSKAGAAVHSRARSRANCLVHTFPEPCKHFPEAEAEAVRGSGRGRDQASDSWACEFCDGAKLIEQASRSNEAVSSLDLDKLLSCNNYNMSCREMSMGESNKCAHNAANSTYNKMGTWILRTRGRDTPTN